ncbi:response regulator transcription factor [Anaerorhabdus furcosa]|uniref:DNA-binding response regulator, OmpR family, contains REC and winged-helix (WHTH) domain n=1 Tax=Anaerorhabdus furcosa TaxID=118967 RepID=A0A1T4KD71_9FIRM|nr:response regulator transcription factor [Anaerorhabdus furcosa]SJZ40350.1 DNA-binding response regulator, OmpR family, contains REC and winged-helix (wHTH) domain [Anaerorhabdus furcosa]
MFRILIVEDDEVITKALCKQIETWGYIGKGIHDFNHVLDEFNEFDPHLVLMDITLPFYNGYYWCTEIRKTSKVPLIFISSASDNMNIIMAMNMGGDDFVAKPFDLNVLIAKVQALLRRTYDFSTVQNNLEVHGAVLNLNDTTLNYENQKIDLTKNEVRILSTLMENSNRFVSRDEMMQALWETDEFIDDNTLTVNVARLRKKLEEAGLENFIITKKGIGYRIAE